MPLAFWVLAGLGGLLIVWAILAPGTRVTMDDSTFVVGDVRNSTIQTDTGQASQTGADALDVPKPEEAE